MDSSYQVFRSFSSTTNGNTTKSSSSFNSSEAKECYLTSVSAGLVLAIQAGTKNIVAQNPGDQDRRQKWIVEQGDQPNTIALRNSGTSEYLHANGGQAGSLCVAGSKQWWKLDRDNVRPPHACRLSPVQHPQVFLNHFQGINVPPGHPGMKVHMWVWEPPNDFCLAWYFMDPTTADSFGPQSISIGSVKDEFKAKEMEARLKDLEQRESTFGHQTKAAESKSNDLEKREAAFKKKQKDAEARAKSIEAKSKDLDERERAFANKEKEALNKGKSETSSAQDLARREAALAQKEKDAADMMKAADAKSDEIYRREGALRQQRQDLDERTRASHQRMAASAREQQEQAAAAKAAETKLQKVLQREAEVERRERELQTKFEAMELEQREEKDSAKEAHNASSSTQSNNGTAESSDGEQPEAATPTPKPKANESRQREPSSSEGGLTRDDLLKLQLRMLKLEEQLARGPRVVAKGDHKNPVVFDCGHKAYPAPRKIRRKVVGIMYE